MKVIALFLLVSRVISIKVFSFEPSGSALSTVQLRDSPKTSLPERFIFCFAMKQDKIDGRSPLLLRDKDNQPWLALGMCKRRENRYKQKENLEGTLSHGAL